MRAGRKGKAKQAEGSLASEVMESRETATAPTASFPVVGIGASAGGLAAIEALPNSHQHAAMSGTAFQREPDLLRWSIDP